MVQCPNSWQFSLRSLLGLIAVLSVSFALIAALHQLGALLALCFVGACGVVVGYRTRRDSVAGVGLVLAIISALTLYVDLTGGGAADGEFLMSAKITVIDRETSAPVPRAEVAILAPQWHKPFQLTDGQGVVEYSERFSFSYGFSGLGITRPLKPRASDLRRYTLYVRAEGYEPMRIRLSEATGQSQWPRNRSPIPPITVVLQK